MEALQYDPLLEIETLAPEAFVIDTDAKAEWALKKIAAAHGERDRLIACCEQMIERYRDTIDKARDDAERDTSYLLYQLRAWFDRSAQKVTKTQATVKLPSGKLRLRFAAPSLVHDDEILMAAYPDYVEARPMLRWGELKKRLLIAEDMTTVIDAETGEMVEGVTVEMKPESFTVEV